MADHGADPGVGSQPWDALIIGDDSLKTAHTVYLFLGAFICLFGLVSLAIKEKLYMSEAMVAVLIGVVVGPFASKLFVPSQIFGQDLNKVTFELTRLVVAIQCMACGVDLPGNYLWREKRSVLVLLGPVMILMWIVTALGIYWIIGLSILDSLIIAACLTPTDPVLANSIVKGRFAEAHIPLNVRLILAAESGANDGLGTPFLFLAFYLQRKSDTGLAIGEWFARIFLYQVCLAVVFGALVAYLARKALKLAERNGWIDKESLISFTISLTLFIMGVCAFLGLDDILAVFIAGNVLTWDHWFNQKIRETHFQEIIDALLNLAFFVYIGSLMPWSLFGSIPQLAVWRLVVLALWVLFLRRLPAVLAMYKWIPALKSPTEAIFAGWFGPVGAGAVFYAQTAAVVLEFDQTFLIPVTFFIILTSVIVHGGTVAFFNMSLQRNSTYQNWASAPLPAVRAPTLSSLRGWKADSNEQPEVLQQQKGWMTYFTRSGSTKEAAAAVAARAAAEGEIVIVRVDPAGGGASGVPRAAGGSDDGAEDAFIVSGAVGKGARPDDSAAAVPAADADAEGSGKDAAQVSAAALDDGQPAVAVLTPPALVGGQDDASVLADDAASEGNTVLDEPTSATAGSPTPPPPPPPPQAPETVAASRTSGDSRDKVETVG